MTRQAPHDPDHAQAAAPGDGRSVTRPPIVVLAGPTGVGKTAVAVELCKRLGGEIVGADSVQVYRGFDIGSAKPTPGELDGVPHHLLDVLEPDEAIDAARYAELADAAISDASARGRVPVVVGGTGLWLRALMRGLLSLPPVDPQLRGTLMETWQREGASQMHRRLRQVDPEAAARIHENDQLRVVRALEVFAQTGRALGALRAAHALGEPRYRALMLVLDVPAPHHVEGVRTRTRAMWHAGWLEETRRLHARHGDRARALGAVGYRQVVEHLSGNRTVDETLAAILQATLAYAKRQRTWFRGDPSVNRWVTPEDALAPGSLTAIARHLVP